METSTEKSVRLPTFDGTEKSFQIWWTRFEAYASVYGFASAIKIGGDPHLPATEATVIDDSTADGKLKAAAKRRNRLAMANLTMAITTEGTLGLVYKTKTKDWPDGDAHLVSVALFKRYQPPVSSCVRCSTESASRRQRIRQDFLSR